MQGGATGSGQPLGSVQAGNEQIQSSPGEKALGELVGETGHAPAVCAGLHTKPSGQQEGGNSAPLLHSGETPPAALHPALGPLGQGGHRPVRASPEEATNMI